MEQKECYRLQSKIMEHEEYEAILNYLIDKSYNKNISENEKKEDSCQKQKIYNQGDRRTKLFYMYTKDAKAVVTEEKKKNAMSICHIHSGGQLGRDKTFEKIKNKYYWKGMFKDVSEFVKTCAECQFTNKKTETHVAPMCSVGIEPRIWSKIGIDLIGPFFENGKPLSDAGYRYVLTVMDYYTKWPEAFPIFSKCTDEVVDYLHKLICRYGVFSTIISDQGGEFNSKLVEQFSSKFGIKHITTSPYHPQANGMIEKFNSTLISMLNKCIDEHGHQWHNYIDISFFAYRTSQHHSTKVSPFFALYIRQPVLVNQQDIAPMENDSFVGL